VGIAFAIPADTVKNVVTQLRDKGVTVLNSVKLGSQTGQCNRLA
jgi:S1-C subfamily serine protease